MDNGKLYQPSNPNAGPMAGWRGSTERGRMSLNIDTGLRKLTPGGGGFRSLDAPRPPPPPPPCAIHVEGGGGSGGGEDVGSRRNASDKRRRAGAL
ncbi:hypothetical protein EVAR_35741_1 [Eumeta japonica]|uniref:Uncharacterized protein n=1 Tax=Eumeta variegata TaxID=151549 RepID=A0A4C1VG81_EUMVA|nr:hypothetical protein EVAR_35741_1 [Eumeta japonica]